MVHHVRMTSAPDFAAPWGATHHFSDLHGPVHWIHWDGPDTEEGRALDPMLLVHGLGGSHLNWLFVGQAWAKERPVYAVDLRGFGLTLVTRPTRRSWPTATSSSPSSSR